MSTAKAIGSSTLQLPDATENYSLPLLVQNFSNIADEVNKDIDGLGSPAISKVAAGSVIVAILGTESTHSTTFALPAGFTAPPSMTATINSNVAAGAAKLNVYVNGVTASNFTIKIQTSDLSAVGVGYNINIYWIAAGY